MTLISIIGDRGSGKTTLSTYLAGRDKREIFSNYWIDSVRYHPLDIEELATMENAIVCGDEWYTEIDSRASGSKGNLYASYILNQSRKDNDDFLITAQLFSSVDLRWRQQSDYIILCLREDDNVIDGDFIYWMYKASNLSPQIMKKKIRYDDMVSDVFPYFHTRQKIALPEKLKGLSFDPKRYIKEIDAIVDHMIIIERIQPRSFTLAAAKDYCRHHNELHQGYAQPIYERMKAKGG